MRRTSPTPLRGTHSPRGAGRARRIFAALVSHRSFVVVLLAVAVGIAAYVIERGHAEVEREDAAAFVSALLLAEVNERVLDIERGAFHSADGVDVDPGDDAALAMRRLIERLRRLDEGSGRKADAIVAALARFERVVAERGAPRSRASDRRFVAGYRKLRDEVERYQHAQRRDATLAAQRATTLRYIAFGTLLVAIALFYLALERTRRSDAESRRRAELAEAEERSLARAERRLRSVLSSASVGLLVVEPDGTIEFASPPAIELARRPADELIGRTLGDLLGREAEAALRGAVAGAGGDPATLEIAVERPGGAPAHLQVEIVDARAEPTIRGFVATLRDVTVRKEIEERLREAELIERASRAKSEFLSRMSHELRTPLNAIMGFAELLELDAEDGDQAESAARILAASRHLLWLIDEVLEISRIEAGALELNLRELNVASCVAEALELTEVHQPDPPLRVAVEVQPGASVVRGDAQRVRQVLVNLLSNAFKYNRPGGAVRVSASCAGDDIHVTVADSGLGIDPRRIPELFHPFHRLGAERSSVPGTGLGLSVAKRLAEAMDGDIVVESEPGIGSRFTLVLPRAAADRPAPTSEQLPRKASNAAA